jgi:hypothetical protein
MVKTSLTQVDCVTPKLAITAGPSTALHLDRRSRQDHRCRNAWAPNIRFDPRALSLTLGSAPNGGDDAVGLDGRDEGLWFLGSAVALPSISRTATPLGSWLRGLLNRAHGNTVVVALASKLVRIAWALLRNETAFVAGGLAAA